MINLHMGSGTLVPRELWLKVAASVFLFVAAHSRPAFAQPFVGDLHISQSKDRVLTTLKIGGSDPIPVFFDTGSSENIVDRKVAARFGLPDLGPSTAIDGSLGKPVPGFFTRIKGANLGSLSIDDGPANAVDYDLPNEKGVFSPNSFPGKLVKIDLGVGTVSVMLKTAAILPSGEGIPYIGKGDDALPSVVVDVGDRQITAELDSGNNAAVLFPLSYTNQLSLEAEPKKVGEASSVAGSQPLFRARLRGSLRVGPLVLDRPVLMFIEGGQPNVGLPILRQLVVILDPSARRSWIIGSRPQPTLKLATFGVALAFGTVAVVILVRWRLRKYPGKPAS
jgi:hypothetical protein